MIKIILNGELLELNSVLSLSDFLKTQQNCTQTFAVAINEEFIARQRYAEIMLNDGDSVEIVAPMQGG